MAKFKNYVEAGKAGFKFSVHKLNQPDKADNGWNYFQTAAEAMEFDESHPDPLNDNAPTFNIF